MLDADPRAIKQNVFTGAVRIASVMYYILEQSKEIVLEFYNRTSKVS